MNVLATAVSVPHFIPSAGLWWLTLGLVALCFLVDFVLQRHGHIPSMRESLVAAIVWTAIGVAFGFFLWYLHGADLGAQYLSGYLLERTLSLDNVFVFVIILNFFQVPDVLRHRALLFGVIMALGLRAIFIAAGGWLLQSFAWMTYLFGGVLVYTAYKLGTQSDAHLDPGTNPMLRLLRKLYPVTDEFHGAKLRVRQGHKHALTPLFATLIALATTDVVFAVDSIPAIFAVTSSTYVVFAANAFALLGLIPLTFLLADAVERFRYLKYALALVLGYVGVKMLLTHFYHIPTWITLIVVVTVLSAGIFYSMFKTRGEEPSDDSKDMIPFDPHFHLPHRKHAEPEE